MSRQIRLKVYGTVKGEKRLTRKHRYYTVTRDKYGKFKSFRKWSQTRPNKPATYKEKYVTTPTGKEAKKKVAEAIEEEQWIEKFVEYEEEIPLKPPVKTMKIKSHLRRIWKKRVDGIKQRYWKRIKSYERKIYVKK